MKIDTDDILILFGEINKRIKVIFNMNFFSRINERNIQIEGKNFSLKADLIKNHIEILSNKKNRKYNWKKYKVFNTYVEEHKKIFKKDLKDFCTFEDSMNTLKMIKQIRGS